MPVPRFVFQVYKLSGNRKEFQGSGVRIGRWLVVPTHVINQKGLWIVYEGRTMAQVDFEEWREIAPDMSALPMSSRFQDIKKAKVCPFIATPYVRVQAGMDAQNASYGMLKNGQSFGQTVYTGSTRAGFSGAAYVDVERLYAIHQGGGVENYGMSAAYIEMRLKYLEKKPEDSELEAIKNSFRRLRNPDDWSFVTAGNPDEYEIRVGGKYWIIDQEMLDDIYDDEFLQDYFQYEDGERVTRRRPRSRKNRAHYEPESATALEIGQIRETVREELKVAFSSHYDKVVEETDRIVFDRIQQLVEEGYVGKKPECADDDEPAFLGVASSASSEETPHIERLREDISSMHSTMQSQIQGCMDGLNTLQEQSKTHLQTTSDIVNKLLASCVRQLNENLMSALEQQLKPIQFHLDNLQTQQTQHMTSTSEKFSQLLTQKAPPASGGLMNTQPSATRLALMDSVLQTYREWRTLNKPSSPDFLSLREEFLKETGLSIQEQASVVKRYTNWWKRVGSKQMLRQMQEPAVLMT